MSPEWTRWTAALAAVALLAACGQPSKPSSSGVFPRTVTHALGKTKLDKSADEKAVTSSGLWAGLGTVKAKHAIAVADEVWFLGLGPIGAMKVLDDLRKYLG